MCNTLAWALVIAGTAPPANTRAAGAKQIRSSATELVARIVTRGSSCGIRNAICTARLGDATKTTPPLLATTDTRSTNVPTSSRKASAAVLAVLAALAAIALRKPLGRMPSSGWLSNNTRSIVKAVERLKQPARANPSAVRPGAYSPAPPRRQCRAIPPRPQSAQRRSDPSHRSIWLHDRHDRQ